MPEDVSFPGSSRPRPSHPRSSRPVPSFSSRVSGTNSCARSTGQEERRCYRILLHTFIQSCFFFLYISLVYISLVYISPLFISPLFISPPNPGPLTPFILSSTHSRPRRLTRHAASANQGSRGKSPPNWIHLYPGTPAQHSRCLCLI